MERPLIAIVGDANKTKNPELARKAAGEIGSELAKRGCRLMVYSSSSDFVEWEVVQGFLRTKIKKEPRSIEVRYPRELHGMFPGESPMIRSLSEPNREGFAVPIGLIAGLTLDRVFPKLIKYELPLQSALSNDKKTSKPKDLAR
jgi:hypothetical protein